MRIRAMSNRIKPSFDQLIRHRLRVFNHLLDIGFEFGAQGFAKGHGFGCDHVHQGSPLNSREDRAVKFFGQGFIIG